VKYTALISFIVCFGVGYMAHPFPTPIILESPKPPPAPVLIADHNTDVLEEERDENDLFPKLNDREFVRLVYRTILKRDPAGADEAGISNWVDHLKRGYTRGWVVWKTMQSEEFNRAHPIYMAK
jgi:hypothetical protein